MTKPIRVNYRDYEEFLTVRARIDRAQTALQCETYGDTVKALLELFNSELDTIEKEDEN